MKRYIVQKTPPIAVSHGLIWSVVDRKTNETVDQATTRYEARMVAEGMNESEAA